MSYFSNVSLSQCELNYTTEGDQVTFCIDAVCCLSYERVFDAINLSNPSDQPVFVKRDDDCVVYSGFNCGDIYELSILVKCSDTDDYTTTEVITFDSEDCITDPCCPGPVPTLELTSCGNGLEVCITNEYESCANFDNYNFYVLNLDWQNHPTPTGNTGLNCYNYSDLICGAQYEVQGIINFDNCESVYIIERFTYECVDCPPEPCCSGPVPTLELTSCDNGLEVCITNEYENCVDFDNYNFYVFNLDWQNHPTPTGNNGMNCYNYSDLICGAQYEVQGIINFDNCESVYIVERFTYECVDCPPEPCCPGPTPSLEIVPCGNSVQLCFTDEYESCESFDNYNFYLFNLDWQNHPTPIGTAGMNCYNYSDLICGAQYQAQGIINMDNCDPIYLIENFTFNCLQCPPDNPVKPSDGFTQSDSDSKLGSNSEDHLFRVDDSIQRTPTVFPNPFTDEFSLAYRAEKEGSYQLVIYNQDGKLISSTQGTFVKGNNQISIHQLRGMTPGYYHYKLITDQNYFTDKLLKF